jgi:hypothetical protein
VRVGATALLRVTLPGVDGSRVNRIDAITIKQKITENATGTRVASSVEVPNLVITLSESDAKPLSEWKAEGKAVTRAAAA